MTKSVSSPTNKKYTVDALFAGVGGIELGFKQTGKFRIVYANEFDKNARKTYTENNNTVPYEEIDIHDIENIKDTVLDGRDIHDVKADQIPDTDVIMGGFPCQAFSIAGYRKGFDDDRGNLFFDMHRMIAAKRPRIVFIENVKNLVSHDHGRTFKIIREYLVESGYYLKWAVLNAKDYGNIPQNRERIYVVGFRNKDDYDRFDFPAPVNLTRTIHDIIDFHGKKDDAFYYDVKMPPFYDKLKEAITSQDTIYQWRRKYVRENKAGVVPTLTANMGTGGHNVPLILADKNRIRKLTPKETFNAQGYPADFKLPKIANGQLYKQAGNSVAVPVIHRIAEQIVKAIDGYDDNKKDFKQNKKYALIRSNIRGRNEGQSYVEKFSDSTSELEEIAHNSDIPLITTEQYFKIIKKREDASFYMIEECHKQY